ncbi:MAG: sigma-70 family RNA polymerase sigma factor [Cyanobacteria bacterium SIG26]|nr:sigma-70 family RNA polymerase sigma factor [Cyanobacteria bacterium SIG26]
MPDNKLLYKKMPLEELVVLSQQEDYKALEELIRKIQKDIYATLSYLLKSNDRLADLTQETLLKVAKNIQNLKNPKCFKGWLNNIITNTYYDEVRKKKNRPETISIDYTCENMNLAFKIELPDPKSKPIEKCITSECEKLIKSAIRELPEIFRIPIILREFQGLSYEEIAKTTNTSVGTVKSRISRARLRLQDALKNQV